MAAAIIAVDLAWTALGLAGRGTVFTIGLVGAEVVIGGAVFFGAAYLLRLEELWTIVNVILRRKPAPTAA